MTCFKSAMSLMAVLSLMTASLLGAPQDPGSSDKALEEKVAALLVQLDGETAEERDAAEKAILELGTEVLPLLPKANSNTPAEMQVRLQRLAEKLQSLTIQTYMNAGTVTIQGSMTVREALEQVEQQTGNSFVMDGIPESEIELDLEEVVFWEALDEILDAAGLDINTFGNREEVCGFNRKLRTQGCDLLELPMPNRFDSRRPRWRRLVRCSIRAKTVCGFEPNLRGSLD